MNNKQQYPKFADGDFGNVKSRLCRHQTTHFGIFHGAHNYSNENNCVKKSNLIKAGVQQSKSLPSFAPRNLFQNYRFFLTSVRNFFFLACVGQVVCFWPIFISDSWRLYILPLFRALQTAFPMQKAVPPSNVADQREAACASAAATMRLFCELSDLSSTLQG